MATDKIYPSLAVRSSVGIELWSTTALTAPYVVDPKFARDESKYCRAVAFSGDGRYFAWVNGVSVNISETKNWHVLHTIVRPKAHFLKFSPSGKYLMTWESYSPTKDVKDMPNLFIYSSETGAEVFATIQKKTTEWEPHWSKDEAVLALMVGGESLFYETTSAEGFTKIAKKIGGGRNGLLSVAPNHGGSAFVAFYTPGLKAAPSMCKIFKYPDLQAPQPIGCKSFFQADTVDMLWNKRGTGLLLLTSTDVDQTGASYYGKQALHFMSTKGDSFGVQLSKDGSVHCVEWNPNSTEFCVVYGFMPAKATFFNLKCDVTFCCGEGDRNSIYYNSFGNMVILAGFGNLQGNVEVWDVAKKKQISTIKAPDTTLLEWCANGETFITATTAPRLRVSNGFKIWHYSGALLHETIWPVGQELLEVVWQTYPQDTFKEPIISTVKLAGIKSSQPQASSVPYRPPNARGIFITPISTNSTTTSSKNSRNAKRTKNTKTKDALTVNGNTALNGNGNPSVGAGNENHSAAISTPKKSPEEVEKSKRIKAVQKKLKDITVLKTRKDKGEHLAPNQVTKIDSEGDLVKQLSELLKVA